MVPVLPVRLCREVQILLLLLRICLSIRLLDRSKTVISDSVSVKKHAAPQDLLPQGGAFILILCILIYSLLHLKNHIPIARNRPVFLIYDHFQLICRVTQSLHRRDDLVVAEVGAPFHAVDVLILFYQSSSFARATFMSERRSENFDEKLCLDTVVSFRACSLHSA